MFVHTCIYECTVCNIYICVLLCVHENMKLARAHSGQFKHLSAKVINDHWRIMNQSQLLPQAQTLQQSLRAALATLEEDPDACSWDKLHKIECADDARQMCLYTRDNAWHYAQINFLMRNDMRNACHTIKYDARIMRICMALFMCGILRTIIYGKIRVCANGLHDWVGQVMAHNIAHNLRA